MSKVVDELTSPLSDQELAESLIALAEAGLPPTQWLVNLRVSDTYLLARANGCPAIRDAYIIALAKWDSLLLAKARDIMEDPESKPTQIQALRLIADVTANWKDESLANTLSRKMIALGESFAPATKRIDTKRVAKLLSLLGERKVSQVEAEELLQNEE